MPAIVDGSIGYTFPDGTVQTTAATAAFVAGTRMSFQQTAAPTGWTKDTTAAIDDSMLRFVTGSASSGGSVAFSTWAATTTAGATTLTTPQIPSHSHRVYNAFGVPQLFGPAVPGQTLIFTSSSPAPTNGFTEGTGGGGSHNHPLSQNLKYYDFIIASKN